MPATAPFQATLYGLLASTPSDVVPRKNSTRATVPSASLALALTVMLAPAAKLLPAAGVVSDTLGDWLPPVPQLPRSLYQPQLLQYVGDAFQMLIWAS